MSKLRFWEVNSYSNYLGISNSSEKVGIKTLVFYFLENATKL